MLNKEMEIPSAETIIDTITDEIFETFATEYILLDREAIKESVIRALEELGVIEVI